MTVWTRKCRICGAVIFACVAALGASYAQNAFSGSPNGSSDSDGAEVVIIVDQKPAFLDYVKRQQMRSGPLIGRVSVGDILPDSGVRYYDIPLRYGAPFYRCVVIGDEVVIADPSTGRVVQVVN